MPVTPIASRLKEAAPKWEWHYDQRRTPPPRFVLEEAVFRARESLLSGALRAGFAVRVGVLSESAAIARGNSAVQAALAIDRTADAGSGVVLHGQPEPDPALPPADVVLQLAFTLLLLRRPGQGPISWPAPPEVPSLGSERYTTGGRLPSDRPLLYDYVHPGLWLRDALRANEGTKRPSTGKALVAAGVLSKSRLRCLLLRRPGRRNRLDAADVDRLAVHARSRLPYLLARALLGRGVSEPDEFAETLAIPAAEARTILRELGRLHLAEPTGGFLDLPDPRADFGAMRLYDDALVWLQRSLQTDANDFFYDFFHGAALATRAEALAEAQRGLLATLATHDGPQAGPWVPVVALTLVHPVTQPLGAETDDHEE